MSMKIIPPNEPIPVNRIAVTIYGNPGVGKTTLACACENGLMLDFDQGAKRALVRGCAVAEPIKWDDVSDPTTGPFQDVQVLVVDTAGKMMDMLQTHVCNMPNCGRDNIPNQMGWTKMKQIFRAWLARVQAAQKDVIFVCHGTEHRLDSGQSELRPQIIGGSRDIIMQASDAIGLVANRKVDFSPRADAITKGSLGVIEIPANLEGDKYFADTLIAKVKASLTQQGEQVANTQRQMQNALDDIAAATDTASLDKISKALALAAKTLPDGVMAILRRAWKKRKTELDKAAKSATPLEQAAQAPATEPQTEGE